MNAQWVYEVPPSLSVVGGASNPSNLLDLWREAYIPGCFKDHQNHILVNIASICLWLVFPQLRVRI